MVRRQEQRGPVSPDTATAGRPSQGRQGVHGTATASPGAQAQPAEEQGHGLPAVGPATSSPSARPGAAFRGFSPGPPPAEGPHKLPSSSKAKESSASAKLAFALSSRGPSRKGRLEQRHAINLHTDVRLLGCSSVPKTPAVTDGNQENNVFTLNHTGFQRNRFHLPRPTPRPEACDTVAAVVAGAAATAAHVLPVLVNETCPHPQCG